MDNKKQLTTDHMLLITRIKKCMIQDEINHIYRLDYKKEWVNRFLDLMVLRGKYTEHEGKILMEFREKFINELKSLY